MTAGSYKRHPSSFRDPSGYVFVRDNEIYRYIDSAYFGGLTKLHDSGLYANLISELLLIPHSVFREEKDFKILRPEQLEFICYPYEWSFGQLKAAAIATLDIHERALNHGMILKDASAYNIQFKNNHPILIDSLSFDPYFDGDPWFGYAQFCRHFLGPLLLTTKVSHELRSLSLLHLDGIPLSLASQLLPFKTHFSPQIKTNIHMHAKSEHKYKESFDSNKSIKLPFKSHLNIVKGLRLFIEGLNSSSTVDATQWGDYYNKINYVNSSFEFKEQTIRQWVLENGFEVVWDVGGNNGHFSRQISAHCKQVFCTDVDPVAVDQNYSICVEKNISNVTPLVVDFMNPPPAIGFENQERESFLSRIDKQGIDCIFALALIHHLCISENASFEMLSSQLAGLAKNLVIEFVPPEDSWAQKLLDSKRRSKQLFEFYNESSFLEAFSKNFKINERIPIPESKRTLFLMRSKHDT